MSRLLRIGEAAEAAGVTTRTLRYYEQRGLLAPTGHSVGGARRYADDDVERLRRIRELADLMGADLDRIKVVLGAEDRLADIRSEYRAPGQSAGRQRELLDEALGVRHELLAQVDAKVAALQSMRHDLAARIAHVEDLLGALEVAAPH